MGKIVEEYITDWAYTKSFIDPIHISQAESGKQGYFCLGCKKEMQAVKGKIREHYFRHHAKNVKNDYTECVRANREYRERIARDILQRLKRLKVPAVYKYPPRGSDGMPNKLAEAEWIEAAKVVSELTFYEDENCEIHYGSDPDIDERYMSIRPDITFFDAGGKPILFLEFVVTHKIDEKKKNKLYRFGINTVQIIIPKKSEELIEQVFKSSRSIKWVYNEIEANTEYVYVSDTSGRGVWEIDDDQRKLFEESYKCRKNQIANLIRSVRTALESESYKQAERIFEREISRVESATEAERAGLESMEERLEGEVRDEFAERRKKLESEGRTIDVRREELREKRGRLEKGYQSTKRKLEEEQERADNVEQLRESTERKSRGIRERIEEVGKEQDEIEERVFQECRSELNQRGEELPRGTRTILEAQRVLSLYPDAQRENRRYRKAYEFFKKGTWKAQ
ncbi:hypothetical protein DSM03_104170 [Leeuwenhoekiella aestuarii]|uniref:hypothetical protein n=1 Tax=Leeuwenhoekiella aestuarii TaxID=2249426 RepID=UPI000FFF2FB3|nr:hypothetical protein [Leeuwenhoekiella aestuarii]RXG15012.1 hypothetical protein DSM03_104170 [Leeuwenhoekiella aestuarii]